MKEKLEKENRNEKNLIEKINLGIALEKILPYNFSALKVYAFVGPSGTGKSFRAQQIAFENGIETIIDDGLLIRGSRVLEGSSAKIAKTKVQTVRAALFSTEEEVEKIRGALKKERVKSLLILGTSDGMVEKIAANLRLPKISKKIYIHEVATKEEMEHALSVRKNEGKHIVPVPTFEIQKDFSGILLDPFSIFKGYKGRKEKNLKIRNERSIIRPTFSYFGKYTIKDKAFRDIIKILMKNVEGIYEVSKIYIDKEENGNDMYISLDIVTILGFNILKEAEKLRTLIKSEIERATSVNISKVDIRVIKVETEIENKK